MRFTALDRISPKTVRFWALIDTGVLALATPPSARLFLEGLYWLNGQLGGVSTAPAFDPLAMFFVNLSGLLVLVWCAARLLRPLGVFALIDTVGRGLVSLLIAGSILSGGVPPVLWLFVGTEMLGALAQGHAVWRVRGSRDD